MKNCIICQNQTNNMLCDVCNNIKEAKKNKLLQTINNNIQIILAIRKSIGKSISWCNNFIQLKYNCLEFYALTEIAEENGFIFTDKMFNELVKRYNTKLAELQTTKSKIMYFLAQIDKTTATTLLQILNYYTKKYEIDTIIDGKTTARKILFDLCKKTNNIELNEIQNLIEVSFPNIWTNIERQFAIC